MARQHRGRVPSIDHARITRSNEPRLRQPIPALNIPVEGANPTLDKVSAHLNRAGSSASNPILTGMATRRTTILNSSDRMRSIYIFRDARPLGSNLIGTAGTGAPGVYTIDFLAGSGRSVGGTPATGAIKNFIRWESARGIIQKEFWVKSFDFDVVALNGLPALDATTLLKDPIDVLQVDPALEWIDVVIDYMVSWNDEFQALHNAGNPHLDPGFLKAYGGAKFVSLFETGLDEGEGTVINPVTQTEIKDQHIVQVQNTTGQKNFTVRFRSKKESPFWVDIDVAVNVIALVCPPGDPPEDDNPAVDDPTIFVDYIPPVVPPITPTDIPESEVAGDFFPYSIAGVTPTVFTGLLETPIVVLTIQGQTTGATPIVVVRRYGAISDTGAPGSVRHGFLDETEYIPLVVSGATVPTQGAPYQAAQAYRIAFQWNGEIVAGVTTYVVMLKDGSLYSKGSAFAAPKVTDLALIMLPPLGRADTTPPT